PVDIVGSGHRVDSFARVSLDGLSKNHAMTFTHSATTRRAPLIRPDSYTTLLDATPAVFRPRRTSRRPCLRSRLRINWTQCGHQPRPVWRPQPPSDITAAF